jgi:hypothetical protein
LHLLLVLLVLTTLTALGGLGLLSADTAGTATTEGRGKSEVDVLLGVETDDERGNVDDLLSDSDVTLADQDTGVVDRLGKTELPDTGLETALKEILDLKSQDVIELHAGLVKDTDTDKTSNEGIAFEETLGVLLVEGKKLTVKFVRRLFFISARKSAKVHIPGSTTDLGQSQTDSPDLTLVAQAILADELQLGVTIVIRSVFIHIRLKQRQAHVQWPVILTVGQTRRVGGGHGRSWSGRGEAS